jgi:hypothetical protein
MNQQQPMDASGPTPAQLPQPHRANPANVAQRRAIGHVAGPLFTIADPGPGMTRTLVERIGHLITVERAAAELILVVTFTAKAAAELTTRAPSRLPGMGRPKRAPSRADDRPPCQLPGAKVHNLLPFEGALRGQPFAMIERTIGARSSVEASSSRTTTSALAPLRANRRCK